MSLARDWPKDCSIQATARSFLPRQPTSTALTVRSASALVRKACAAEPPMVRLVSSTSRVGDGITRIGGRGGRPDASAADVQRHAAHAVTSDAELAEAAGTLQIGIPTIGGVGDIELTRPRVLAVADGHHGTVLGRLACRGDVQDAQELVLDERIGLRSRVGAERGDGRHQQQAQGRGDGRQESRLDDHGVSPSHGHVCAMGHPPSPAYPKRVRHAGDGRRTPTPTPLRAHR